MREICPAGWLSGNSLLNARLRKILRCNAGLYQQAEYRYIYFAYQRALTQRAEMNIIPEHFQAYVNAVVIMPVLAFFVDALKLNMIAFIHNLRLAGAC